MAFEFYISRRYLWTKQKRTFIFLITLLSVAGVTVGVTALVVVIAVMAGFESDLKSRILGVEAHILLERREPLIAYRAVMDRIQTLEGITAAVPYVNGQVLVRSDTGMSGAVVRGIDPESGGDIYRNLDGGLLKKAPADAAGSQPPPQVILGGELAGSLGVTTGDMVDIISPHGTISPAGHLPGMKRFQAAGVFTTGIYEYDGSLIFMDLADARKLFRMGEGVSGIAVQVDDIYGARQLAGKIADLTDGSYRISDWTQRNRNLFFALKLEKIAMFVILVLIILVAAFNIAGTLMMTVMEKNKDIAILRAIGSTRKSIRKIFVFKGMIVGLIGVVFGTGSGVALCEMLKYYKFIELPDDVYYVTTLPVRLDLLDISAIAVAALIICFLATLYPAHQASKLNPVEALRYG